MLLSGTQLFCNLKLIVFTNFQTIDNNFMNLFYLILMDNIFGSTQYFLSVLLIAIKNKIKP